MAKTITAKFASACAKCGGWIEVGAKVEWEPGKKAWHAKGCPAVKVEPPKKVKVETPVAEVAAAVEAAIAAAEAKLAAAEPAYEPAAAAARAALVAAGGCPACHGKHRVPCCNACCEGGSVRVMSDVWEVCRTCHGSGAEACAACEGSPPTETLYATSPEFRAAREAAESISYEIATAKTTIESGSRELEALKAPKKGALVKVFKGRKVPVGTTGACIWIGETKFGTRVGIKTASGEVYWTAASNVEALTIVKWVTEEPAAKAA
jgi:hypothetical protein